MVTDGASLQSLPLEGAASAAGPPQGGGVA